MRKISSWTVRAGLAVLATCGFVTCNHDVPGPAVPAPREAPPLGPQPQQVPQTGADPAPAMTPEPGARGDISPCPGQLACPDGGLPTDPGEKPPANPPTNPGPSADIMPPSAPLAARAPADDLGATRMSVTSRPRDAGVDAIVPLPPLPDGGVLRDAGQPMR